MHPVETAQRGDRRAIALFLGLAFGWAWALWGYWLPTMPPGGLAITPGFLVMALLGGLAPTLAALVTLRVLEPATGWAAFVARLRDWRAPRALYGFALLAVPAVSAVSVAIQAALIGPLVWPEPSLLAVAAIWPLMAALGEEPGWRGFLLPRLARRMSLLSASIVIGLIWGLWHLPADYIGLKAYGDWFWLAFLVNGPLVLTGHALILSWLWRRSGGNIALAVVYHATITASAIMAPSAAQPGVTGVLAALVGALLFCGLGALLVTLDRRAFLAAPAGAYLADRRS